MIGKIVIKGLATYSPTVAEEMVDLKKINFVYGSNGTGKTTISRVIANCASYENCSLDWRGGLPIDTFVYNRDFVDQNFNQPGELKGIFTLGEKDKGILDKIDVAKSDLEQINAKVIQLKATLKGENGDGGKVADLENNEKSFVEKCWNLKKKHDEKLKGAFVGVRGDSTRFKEKLIEESISNTSTAIPLADIERKAETIFGEAPQEIPVFMVPNTTDILAHESNSILKKNIIGKADVDIAALIKKLGNSDWVKQGRGFYNPEEPICPFCQQNTMPSLEKSLNAYFDESFIEDTATIEKLHTDYKAESDRIRQDVQTILETPSKFIDVEQLQSTISIFDSKIQVNIQRIEEKRRESSKSIELDSLSNILDKVKKYIETANSEAQSHNTAVSNIKIERIALTGQVWRYLLDHEIKGDLVTFIKKKAEIKREIENFETQIKENTKGRQTKDQEIKDLEKDTTSIQPTIDEINKCLNSFGFDSFNLAKSDQGQYYKIQRPDGSDAEESLSEGERSFITFLYFYHLIKGSHTESGTKKDCVVVFDDPVSSMGSDILFIVSSLIRSLFKEVRDNNGTIKQVFILTHNLFFYKEISFTSTPSNKGRKDEIFWTVRKVSGMSKIKRYGINPIKTSYELLWSELKNDDRDKLTIQNTMRRILEYYYKILGNVDLRDLPLKFEGGEQKHCQSLLSWMNAGSHILDEPLYFSTDDSTINSYLKVFKQIFEKTGHIAHYDMMMEENDTAVDAKISETVTP